MTWIKRKYTKEEREHLAEMNIVSIDDMKVLRKFQKEMESKNDGYHACFLCDQIARKMGIEK
jgi:hypothetical protein